MTKKMEIMLMLLLVLLIAFVLLDGAWLIRHRAVGIVRSKRTYLSAVNWSLSRKFVVEIGMKGKKYSTFVSKDSYEKIEKGDEVLLEYRKRRFSRSLIIDLKRRLL